MVACRVSDAVLKHLRQLRVDRRLLQTNKPTKKWPSNDTSKKHVYSKQKESVINMTGSNLWNSLPDDTVEEKCLHIHRELEDNGFGHF